MFQAILFYIWKYKYVIETGKSGHIDLTSKTELLETYSQCFGWERATLTILHTYTLLSLWYNTI